MQFWAFETLAITAGGSTGYVRCEPKVTGGGSLVGSRAPGLRSGEASPAWRGWIAAVEMSCRFGRTPAKTQDSGNYHNLPLSHKTCNSSRYTPTIRIRNRPAKQVGDQRWLNQHSMNRGSTRQSVLCAVSASPECLMNRGELHRLRTGSPAHRSRPSGPGSTFLLECPRQLTDLLICPLLPGLSRLARQLR